MEYNNHNLKIKEIILKNNIYYNITNEYIFKQSLLYYNILWNQYAPYYNDLNIHVKCNDGNVRDGYIIYNIVNNDDIIEHDMLPIEISDSFFKNNINISVINNNNNNNKTIRKKINLNEFINVQINRDDYKDNVKLQSLINFFYDNFPRNSISINNEKY